MGLNNNLLNMAINDKVANPDLHDTELPKNGKKNSLLDLLFSPFKRKKFTATSPQLGLSDEEIKNLPKWGEHDKPSVEMLFSEIVGNQEWERLQRQKANFEELAKSDKEGWMSPNEQLYRGYGIHRDKYYKDNLTRIGTGKDSDFQDSEGRVNRFAKTLINEAYKRPNQLGGLVTGGLMNNIPWFIGMKDVSLADQKILLRHEPYHNQQYPSPQTSGLTPVGKGVESDVINNRLNIINELMDKDKSWNRSRRSTEYITEPVEFQVRVQGVNQFFNEQGIPVTKRNIKRLQKQLENLEFREKIGDKQNDVLQMLDMLKDSPTANKVFWQLQPVSLNNRKNKNSFAV